MHNNLLKVIDAPGLYRDPNSKAIIAADPSALLEHRKKKAIMASILNKNKAVEEEISELKKQVSDIQQTLIKLTQLLEK
jgi:hypothetical protein